MTYSHKRFLVIAKTYPELSSKYGETVCTAAVDENGIPFRLYPIPFRYLVGSQRFDRYQWITAPVRKSEHDSRPESYQIKTDEIAVHEFVPTTRDEWGVRAEVVLKNQAWQFSSMNQLLHENKTEGRSLAFIYPHKILKVHVRKRSSDDEKSFDEKLEQLRTTSAIARKQLHLFETSVPREMKSLQYVGRRVCVDWLCSDATCGGHSMQILDWEICELSRRDGMDAAITKVKDLLSDRYRTGFIVGNFFMYPASFAIIGLW